MIEDFMIRAALSGIAICMITGPVGCFILWRKLAYFGDALAHSALLGIALAFYLQIDAILGVFIIAVLTSLLLVLLKRVRIFSGDAILGVLSHAGLAFGLIAVSMFSPGKARLTSLLFGDILGVSMQEVWTSFGVAAGTLLVLLLQWRSLIAYAVSEDIAQAERISFTGSETLFMVLCSGLVAVAMKITGVLLISALLILPAAIARVLARSPEQMAILAIFFGIVSVMSGLMASLEYDLPSGPAIIAAATVYFIVALAASFLVSVIRSRK